MSRRRIIEDFDHYTRAFAVFNKYSQDYDSLSSILEIMMGKILRNLQNNCLRAGEDLRILGVGSGTGDVDLLIISMLLQTFPNIKSSVVEPLPQYIMKYKESVEKQNHTGVKWDWQQVTWQQYYEKGEALERNKFHFISAIHSLYYFDQPETIITQLLDCLEDGGVLFVVLKTGFPDAWQLTAKYPEYSMVPKCILTELNSKDYKKVLERYRMQYDLSRQKCRLNITHCFEEDNEEGKLLLDFIMQTVGFRETTPVEKVNDLLQFIRIKFSESIGGQVWLPSDSEVIVASK